MEIAINDFKKILTIQSEFSEVFPYLQIRFFTEPTITGKSKRFKSINSPSLLIGECREKHNNGVIRITPQMTVADLEKVFLESFGLRIQIVRKSGKAWLETSVTGSWTLSEQNEQGFSLST